MTVGRRDALVAIVRRHGVLIVFILLVAGMFVTTSRFQPGGSEVSALACARGMAIELLDAPRFFEELKIAQRSKFEAEDFEKYYSVGLSGFE